MSDRDDFGGSNGDALAHGESSTALVSADASDAPLIGVAEVVERTGWSAATVRRKARALGGVPTPQGWRFPALKLERRVETMRVTLGAQRSSTPEPDVGQRAAAIYARLEDGQSSSAIVRELREPPEFVRRVREQWIEGYKLDRKDIEFRCACGKASNPHTARCDDCFRRMRPVSEEQMALLHGQEIPTGLHCAACDRLAGRGLCGSCMHGLEIVVNGAGVVSIQVRDVQLAILTKADLQRLMSQLSTPKEHAQ